MKTVFLRVLEAEDKAAALLEAVQEPGRAKGRQRFEVDQQGFSDVPRSPFAYWVSEQVRRLFKDLPPLESNHRSAKQGLATSNDPRFLRLAWETFATNGWVPYAKGGEFSRFYSDIYLLVHWGRSGAAIKAEVDGKYSHIVGYQTFWVVKNPNHYFRSGLTWPRRTQGGLSMRAMPAGCIFADKGPAAFVEEDDTNDLLALLATANSLAFNALVDMQMAFGSYEVGVLQRTPVPNFSDSEGEALACLARRAWSLKRSLDTRTETSHAFTLPALLQVGGVDIAVCAAAWSEHVCTVEAELSDIQAEIDDRCFTLYGINEADRRSITEGFGTQVAEDLLPDAEEDAGEDPDENESTADAAVLAAEFVSWAVGVAFGRFDVRLATGARSLPTEPEPFDPLPACSPGMLTGENGLPLSQPPADYPLAFPASGILVDDPGHAQDLATAVRAVFDVVFGADADRWWHDVAALLDPKNHDLRNWLAGSFFEHHLKRHSKSRRKAPILWQLRTPSGRYSVWLYAHRLTRDSFFQLQNEVVGPKLDHEERQLTSLIQNAGGSPSAAERKAIAAQEGVVEELRPMKAEVQRVTPLWNPNLDDGVVLTMAPLWRLVPQHKPWQKELKAKWHELAAGKYDWAHLAMHLWPERVVPKCATDRSLAIAHGLEETFWLESTDGKWQARPTPTRPVEEIVGEWSSPAVQAALKSLLDAPTSGGSLTRTQKRKTDA